MCSVDNDDCVPGFTSRGLCPRHYGRFKRGAPMSSSFVVSHPVDRELVFLLDEGLYQYEIAAILGCSQSAVTKILNGTR